MITFFDLKSDKYTLTKDITFDTHLGNDGYYTAMCDELDLMGHGSRMVYAGRDLAEKIIEMCDELFVYDGHLSRELKSKLDYLEEYIKKVGD